jgi:hypothetical protein
MPLLNWDGLIKEVNMDWLVEAILYLWNVEGLMPQTIANKLQIDIEVVEDTIEAPGNYALELADFGEVNAIS